MLCHRCEYRLLNILGIQRGPRMECEVTDKTTVEQLRKMSLRCCYSFVPVRPVVMVRKADRHDPRPTGTGYFAARSEGVETYEGELEIHGLKGGWVGLYARPEQPKVKKPKKGRLV